MSEPLVLIIGAADTGRAPMAAALLGRLAARQGLRWGVGSAGVVGHDGDPAEPEARSAMLALGLDIGGHVARSLSPELAAAAAIGVAVDSGVARVVRANYPDLALATLGELAGSPRNIPDPFRMQLGAWLQYAGEIEALLRAGLPRLRTLIEQRGAGEAPSAPEQTQARPDGGVGQELASEGREAVVDRAVRLLELAAELPGVIDGPAALARLTADLSTLEASQSADDLARPYVALIRARLSGDQSALQGEAARALAAAVARLRSPIVPADLEALARAFA